MKLSVAATTPMLSDPVLTAEVMAKYPLVTLTKHDSDPLSIRRHLHRHGVASPVSAIFHQTMPAYQMVLDTDAYMIHPVFPSQCLQGLARIALPEFMTFTREFALIFRTVLRNSAGKKWLVNQVSELISGLLSEIPAKH